MKRHSIKQLLLVAAALSVASALAACGGSDSSASGDEGSASTDVTVTTSSYSKAEYIKLANKICDRERSRLVAELGAYLEEHEGEASYAKLSHDAAEVIAVPVVEGKIEELQALGAPAGDEKKIEAFLSSMQEATDTSDGFKLKDFKRSADLARAYGMGECAFAN
jgi:hypothetical protein